MQLMKNNYKERESKVFVRQFLLLQFYRFSVDHNDLDQISNSSDDNCEDQRTRDGNASITFICAATVVYDTSTGYNGVGLSTAAG